MLHRLLARTLPLVPVTSAILLAFIALAHTAQAQVRRIVVDKEPAYLFADPATGRVHVLTVGVDNNFNGVIEPDSADVPGRWFVIDAATERVVDSLTFDCFNAFPLRAGLDLKGGRIYLAQSGRVRAYDINTLKLVRDTVVLGHYSAVSFDSAAGRLMLAQRLGFTDPGNILVVDPAGGDTLAIARTGVNPAMSVSSPGEDGAMEYLTLNEGVFGQKNSSVGSTLIARDVYRIANDTTMVGGGAYIITRGNRVFIALGGGHRLHIIDPATNRDVPFSPVTFGPVRQNGPRALAFQGDSVVLMCTYSDELIRINASNGAIIDTIMMLGKAEEIAVRDSLAYVAIRYNHAGNSPDSVLEVVNLNTGRVIDTMDVVREPVSIFFARNGDLHVISHGDGERVWQVYDGLTRALKESRPFTTATLDNPFRVVYDAAADTAYAMVADTVRAISVGSAGPWRNVYATGPKSGRFIAVSDAGEYLLLIEATATGTGGEYAHLITKNGELLGRFKTNGRPTMAARIPGSSPDAVRFYVLDRATPGQQKSQVDMFEYRPNVLGNTELGGGGNHLLLQDERLLVTLNGTNELAAVDFHNGAVLARVPMGTTGFNGPREAIRLSDNRIVASTYEGDVRVVGPTGLVKAYATGGKSEGLVAVGEKVFVANIFAPDYSPDSVVVVFDATTLVASVRRDDAIAAGATLEQNVPNPATEQTAIRFRVDRGGRVVLRLHTLAGALVQTLVDRQMEAGTYAVDLRTEGLPSGSYVYTVAGPSGSASRVMQVVR